MKKVEAYPPDRSSGKWDLNWARGKSRRGLAFVARWPETGTLVILLGAFVAGHLMSPYFLDPFFLFDSTSLYMEIGILALAMTLVIVSGNIDLSVASGLALTAALSAILHVQWGVPMILVIPCALAIGAALGLFNGLLVTRLGLPSLTVTLGTLALYRGLAQVLVGDHSLSGFPEWFTGIDYIRLGNVVPAPLIVFAVLAVAFGLLLHKTVFGRCVFAIGANETAARYSGMPVERVKLIVFVLSGLMMGVGALLMLSRLGVARYDHALGAELVVITTVVLGGVHIFGGHGRLLGVAIALFALGILSTGMGVANVASEAQLVVVGSLLLAAIAFGNWLQRFRR